MRRKLCYALLPCLISLVWIGCGEDEDGGLDPKTTVQSKLTGNRNKWQSKEIRDYEFTFQWNCFCTEEFVAAVNVSIRDGTIDTIVSVEDGISVNQSRFKDYRSVDELFNFIQEAIDQKAHEISVTYDSEFGYPKEGYIDYEEFTIDEEKGFRVGDFVNR